MIIRRLADCPGVIAGDGTRLFELLHPARDNARVNYSFAVAQLGIKRSSRPHRLRQSEAYFILRGAGRMHVGSRAVAVRAGHLVYVPPDTVQWLENTGWQTMKFICIVDPAWTAAGETVLRPRAGSRRSKV